MFDELAETYEVPIDRNQAPNITKMGLAEGKKTIQAFVAEQLKTNNTPANKALFDAKKAAETLAFDTEMKQLTEQTAKLEDIGNKVKEIKTWDDYTRVNEYQKSILNHTKDLSVPKKLVKK
jgi:hypothetical protein